jgi:peroxiredoxin
MPQMPIQPGDTAPNFTLPAVNHDGSLSLEELRSRSAVLLCFFRGLTCPFCRRQIAQLGAMQGALQNEGVESVGIITTPVHRARFFSRYRPARLPLAADAEADTHRAYGIPRFNVVPPNGGEKPAWPQSLDPAQIAGIRINPLGALPERMTIDDAAAALHRMDGFEPDDEDIASGEAHWNQLGGLFLIDRDGIVRWSCIEAWNHVSEIGSFPSLEELIDATRHLTS